MLDAVAVEASVARVARRTRLASNAAPATSAANEVAARPEAPNGHAPVAGPSLVAVVAAAPGEASDALVMRDAEATPRMQGTQAGANVAA